MTNCGTRGKRSYHPLLRVSPSATLERGRKVQTRTFESCRTCLPACERWLREVWPRSILFSMRADSRLTWVGGRPPMACRYTAKKANLLEFRVQCQSTGVGAHTDAAVRDSIPGNKEWEIGARIDSANMIQSLQGQLQHLPFLSRARCSWRTRGCSPPALRPMGP